MNKLNSNKALHIFFGMFRGIAPRIGIGCILGVFLFVLLGPLFIHYSPYVRSGLSNSPPSLSHLFGTDFIGRDVASQVIWGAYPTLDVAVFGALGATVLGLIAGILSGYYDRAGTAIGGGSDVIMTLPTLPALLLIGSLFLATDLVVILLLIAFVWVTLARAVRAQVMSVKKLAFIDAAKTTGLGDLGIVFTVLLPEVGAIAIAYFILNFTLAIAITTTLQFLGVGNPSVVTWGSILYWAQKYGFFYGDWWWVLAPGLLISLVTVGFSLLGFSLEEIMHPRLKTKA